MSRKSKKLNREKITAAKRLEEMQRMEEEAIKEEQKIISDAEKQIKQICENAGLFCGAILTPEHLGGIVQLAVTSKETIQLPFTLYFKEEN